jgi:hypothetical protein
VQKLDGVPLIYVLDRNYLDKGEVSIFTTPELAIEATGASRWPIEGQAPGQMTRPSLASAQAVTLGGYVSLFKDINYGRAQWDFYPHWGTISDFRHVYGVFGYSINDEVSSMDVNVHADPPGTEAWVILYEDIDFAGEQLWTSDSVIYDDGGPGMRADFDNIGWNDRASALAYGYSVHAT